MSWVDPIIIVWGRVTSYYNDSREYSCSLPRLNHVTIRPPQYVMRTSMLFMATYPVRSVLSDDHVSADMRTPFFHTVSSAICLPDLHDQIDITWAHGVVVSHPLRMRKALGSNPSVSMHMCTHDSDGRSAYDVVMLMPSPTRVVPGEPSGKCHKGLPQPTQPAACVRGARWARCWVRLSVVHILNMSTPGIDLPQMGSARAGRNLARVPRRAPDMQRE